LAENNYAYWDGFLGDYGNITRGFILKIFYFIFFLSSIKGDDRVFTTAVMLNALLGFFYKKKYYIKNNFL